uniref:Uncharacterized protein n=1 Tax=Ditylenchus dipsaci TaxID=166011 RepID=A0A915EEZ8_9BILA
MVAAVVSGDTDGVGLGRPVTGEPDIARKLLKDGVHSCLTCHFDLNNAATVCNIQMRQAGETTLEQANGNVCHGIWM